MIVLFFKFKATHSEPLNILFILIIWKCIVYSSAVQLLSPVFPYPLTPFGTIYLTPNQKTVEALMSLDLPAGVEIEITL